MATITIASRNVNGTYTSPSARISNRFKLPIKFQAVLTDAQFADTSKSLRIDVQTSSDNSIWKPICFFEWKGGVNTFKGLNDYTRPFVVITEYPSLSDKYIRAVITTPSILNVGFTITYGET